MDDASESILPTTAPDDGRGRTFPCGQCGADLHFHIGQQQLKCPFCGAEREIPLDEQAAVAEQDFQAALERLRELRTANVTPGQQSHQEIRCNSCGADVVFEGTLTSTSCPYCGSPLQREKAHTCDFGIPVDGVLPFQVERRRAAAVLGDWVSSRWFAPNDFKRTAIDDRFQGVYLPFWTYDSLTFTKFRGERGENYTVTVGTGKDQRTETRTRWYPVSGSFQRFFDDVLVNASRNLPVKYIDGLAPWPLSKCRPFSHEYLAGYFARTFDVELDEGFDQARARIEAALHQDVCRRIGGDHQRVHKLDCRYDAITFKHLLLPVWMLAYRYKDKSYRVFINAVTGQMQGERPYSWVKILLTLLAAVACVLLIGFSAAR